jgi:hypothetical protein
LQLRPNLTTVGSSGFAWRELAAGPAAPVRCHRLTASRSFALVAKIGATLHGTGAFAGQVLTLEAMGPAIDADFVFLAEILTR